MILGYEVICSSAHSDRILLTAQSSHNQFVQTQSRGALSLRAKTKGDARAPAVDCDLK